LHTNGRDEALSLPTEESARLALRTQQIIANESGVTSTADPLGGSEHVEHLTDSIEAEAMNYLEIIDGMGGTLMAIEKGYIQREIQNAAYDFQRSVDREQTIVVGVNRFRQDGAAAFPGFRLDPNLESQQIERLRNVRAGRSVGAVKTELAGLEQAARTSDNLMPHIVNCAAAFATVGEIAGCLRNVFGEYRESLA